MGHKIYAAHFTMNFKRNFQAFMFFFLFLEFTKNCARKYVTSPNGAKRDFNSGATRSDLRYCIMHQQICASIVSRQYRGNKHFKVKLESDYYRPVRIVVIVERDAQIGS